MLKAVLFDFDGTLVDSLDTTVGDMHATMQFFNLRLPSREEFVPLQGLHVREFFSRLHPHLTTEQVEEAFQHYQNRPRTFSLIKLIPNSIQTLETLNKKYQLGMVTSRGKPGVEALFKKFDLGKYFNVVVDRDDITQHKPHPQGILNALQALHLKPEEAIYVGDAIHDVQTAHNAGMLCILVSKDKENFGADYHLRDIQQVPDVLSTFFG